VSKIYTTVPGLELRIDSFGTATETSPVEVPETVAASLREDPRLRIEAETPAPRLGRKVTTPLKTEKEG
jgi:hypothetical protein